MFALLGLYALGVAVFLLAGGAQPAMTSLVAMEAEVESGEVGVAAGQTSPDDSASSQRTATDATEAASTAATTTEPPPACSDINPVDHGVNPGLTGVHALEFVTLEEQPAAFAGYEGCPLIVNFFASWCVPCVTRDARLSNVSGIPTAHRLQCWDWRRMIGWKTPLLRSLSGA